MEKTKKVLVSGGSIAGLTLTYWLQHSGFDVTVIERNNGLRLGGQNIDVKGAAWEVIKKMGLGKEVVAANTTEVGIRFVNTRDKVVAEFPKESALSMTQELEILRGDLVDILYNKVKDKATFHFDRQIKTITDQEKSVGVTFNNGEQENFDLVLIAEGIGSVTRQLVFGSEVKFNYLGLYCAYLTMARAKTDSGWARWCNAVGAIVFLIRPDNSGTTRVSIFFSSPERGYEKLPIEKQKQLLISKIENVGWEAPRIAEAIRQSDDLYFERVSQVKAPRWHKGRVAMVGDAAYCVTPIAGKGTDLAVAGAYLLAGELSTQANFKDAFAAYESRLRKYVLKVQKLPPGVPGLVYPKSKIGVAILNFFFSVAGSKLFKFIVKSLSKNKKEPKQEIEMPDFNFTAS